MGDTKIKNFHLQKTDTNGFRASSAKRERKIGDFTRSVLYRAIGKRTGLYFEKTKRIAFEKVRKSLHQSKNPPFRKTWAKYILLCKNGKIQSEGNTTIQSLYDKYGIQQCETSQVLKITEDYYWDLFRAGQTNKQYQSEILNKPKVRIIQNQQSFCDKDFELTELEEGMKKLPIGRSPGLDCLPVEFYRKMWPNLKLDFLEMVKEVRNTKNLSDSQNKGVIRLIFKKEDRSDLKFYRPISLLNVDVKIITKTLALHVGRVLPSIISNDQTCIPGRNIASNLHTLNGIVKYANSKTLKQPYFSLIRKKLLIELTINF